MRIKPNFVQNIHVKYKITNNNNIPPSMYVKHKITIMLIIKVFMYFLLNI